jgi:fibronectin-binding autotransporter adhesin
MAPMNNRFAPAVLTALSFVALLGTATVAKGQTVYLWSGLGTDTNWSTTANWFLEPAPPPSDVNDTILGFSNLGLGGSTLSTMNSNFAARGLEFALGTGALDYTIANGGAFTLTLGVDGILNSSGSQIIGLNIAMNSAQSWINNGTGMSITGTVANGGNLLTVNGSGNTSISGVISGTGGLTKTGAGTLTLSGVNSYTGFTRISNGILSISQDLNLGTAPGVATPGSLVIDAGTLAATASFAIATSRGIVVGPNGGSGFGTIDVASGQTVTYGGVIASPGATGGLIKAGAGTLTLSGINTYSGATQIDNGVLSIGVGGNIPTGTAPIIVNGGTLRSTSATIGSTTVINGTHPIVIGSVGGATTGTIEVTAAAGVMIYSPPTATATNITSANGAATGTIIKTGPGTLRLTNTTTGFSSNNTVQKLVVLGGLWQGGLDTVFGAVPVSPLSDAITLNGGGISSNAGFSLVANRGITLGASGGTVSTSSALNILGKITGSGSLTKTGSGSVAANTLTLSNAANDYSGGTFIASGTLLLSSTNRLPVAGNVSFTGASTVLTLGTTTVVASQSINALNSSGGLGTINTGSNAGTATLTIGNGDGSGSYSGIIANNSNNVGLVAVTKTGNGTQAFSGASTYSGATNINGGTLLINNTTGSGTGSGVVNVNANGTLGGTGIINGAVTVSGANSTLAPGNSIGTLTVNNAVTLGANSTYSVELNATGFQADLLKSTSLILSGATLNVNLTGSLTGTEVFLVAQNVTVGTTAVSGQFTGLANGSTVGTFGGVPLFIYYDSSNIVGGMPNTEPGAIILSPSPVPEPTTILAVGALAFAAMGGIRRLRRRDTASPALAA